MGIFSSTFGSRYDSKPAVNVDGAMMVGDIDVHGNFYGVTQDDHSVNGDISQDSFLHDVGIESLHFESTSLISTDDCIASSNTFADDGFSPSFGADECGSDFSSSDSFSSCFDD